MESSKQLDRRHVPILEQDIIVFNYRPGHPMFGEVESVDMIPFRKKGERHDDTTPRVVVVGVPETHTPHQSMTLIASQYPAGFPTRRDMIEGICCPKCWAQRRYTGAGFITKLLEGIMTDEGQIYRYCTVCDYQKFVRTQ